MLRETANESSPIEESRYQGTLVNQGTGGMPNALVPYDSEANSPQKETMKLMQAQEMSSKNSKEQLSILDKLSKLD